MKYSWYFDEFYVSPETIRASALNGNFSFVSGGFKGLECRLDDMDISAVMGRIASILGCHIEYSVQQQGLFRSLTAGQEHEKVKQVHCDRMGLSGIVFLGDPYPAGQTSFYRHRDTGLLGIEDRRALKSAARRRKQKLRDLLLDLDNDGAHLDRWDLVDCVEYEFNRLVVFDTDRFHLAGPGVGSGLQDSKLTQNFNFYPLEPWRFWRRLCFNSRSTSLDVRRPY
jgi:hypothetical protein